MMEDGLDMDELLAANNADRERYFAKVINGRERAREQHSKIPLKIAPVEEFPKCLHCGCRFATVASLKDHLGLYGCTSESPKKHQKPIKIVQKQPSTNTIVNQNKGVSG